MTRKGREWCGFLLTRLVGTGVDTLVMLVAYVLAFAVRMEFREPSFGWRATVLCFVFTWMVQMFSLIVTGGYRIPWRRIRPLDLPRYVGAALLSGGVLTVLRLVFNEGAAWGVLAGRQWLLSAVSAAMLAVLWWNRRELAAARTARIAAGVLAGGIAGNLVDRVFRGRVVDFLDFHWRELYHYPTFNVADAAICAGVGLLLLHAVRCSRKKP